MKEGEEGGRERGEKEREGRGGEREGGKVRKLGRKEVERTNVF
jgi:hypothetical protein